MIQAFQSIALQPQRAHCCCLTTSHAVLRPRDLELFDNHHSTASGVQRDVHSAVGVLPNELSSDPFEDRYHITISASYPDHFW